MRLDVWLHRVCLMRSRTMAGEACQRGKITIEGRPARASHEVRIGEKISIDLGRGEMNLEVVDVPAGNVSKAVARTLYRMLS